MLRSVLPLLCQRFHVWMIIVPEAAIAFRLISLPLHEFWITAMKLKADSALSNLCTVTTGLKWGWEHGSFPCGRWEPLLPGSTEHRRLLHSGPWHRWKDLCLERYCRDAGEAGYVCIGFSSWFLFLLSQVGECSLDGDGAFQGIR